MKRLFIASLLAPGIASAGVVFLDAKQASAPLAIQGPKLSIAPATVPEKEIVTQITAVDLPKQVTTKEKAVLPVVAPLPPLAEPEQPEIVIKSAVVTTAAVIEPVLPDPIWVLTAGNTVGHELQAWAKEAGWKVVWNMGKDWSVPATTSFPGDFKAAATSVIHTLAANGALVRAQFFDGNKTLVVTGPGVVAQ